MKKITLKSYTPEEKLPNPYNEWRSINVVLVLVDFYGEKQWAFGYYDEKLEYWKLCERIGSYKVLRWSKLPKTK